MHDYDLILTLTGGLGAALVFGYFTHRIGLSPIVGYLLAGAVVGPQLRDLSPTSWPTNWPRWASSC